MLPDAVRCEKIISLTPTTQPPPWIPKSLASLRLIFSTKFLFPEDSAALDSKAEEAARTRWVEDTNSCPEFAH